MAHETVTIELTKAESLSVRNMIKRPDPDSPEGYRMTLAEKLTEQIE